RHERPLVRGRDFPPRVLERLSNFLLPSASTNTGPLNPSTYRVKSIDRGLITVWPSANRERRFRDLAQSPRDARRGKLAGIRSRQDLLLAYVATGDVQSERI